MRTTGQPHVERAGPSLEQDRPDHDNCGGRAREEYISLTQTRSDTTDESYSEPKYLYAKSS